MTVARSHAAETAARIRDLARGRDAESSRAVCDARLVAGDAATTSTSCSTSSSRATICRSSAGWTTTTRWFRSRPTSAAAGAGSDQLSGGGRQRLARRHGHAELIAARTGSRSARISSTRTEGVYVNRLGDSTGKSFWYDIFPNVLFYQVNALVSGRCRARPAGAVASRMKWHEACVALGGKTDPLALPNFDHTGLNLATMQPVETGWIEPEAAAGIAWLEYMAWVQIQRPAFSDRGRLGDPLAGGKAGRTESALRSAAALRRAGRRSHERRAGHATTTSQSW